nr:response regulator transcription factor [Maliibacterium massiliense]
MENYNVLLVEDNDAVAEGIVYMLKSEGMQVCASATLKAARQALAAQCFDLILLDIMLPDGSGLDLCSEVRARAGTPIIFLTACDEEYNVVIGLDRGGDDYITKPFRVRELLSRIRAVMRRRDQAPAPLVLASGDITLDVQRASASKGGQALNLTALEFRLLAHLIAHKGRILTRSGLLEALWDNQGQFVDDNTLSVHMRRLREKIDDPKACQSHIVTVRGVGYRWEE